MRKINQNLLINIYNEIKLNPNVTEVYLANKYEYNERTIRRYIKYLKDSGFIKLVGVGRKRKWIVNNYLKNS